MKRLYLEQKPNPRCTDSANIANKAHLDCAPRGRLYDSARRRHWCNKVSSTTKGADHG